MGAVSSTQGNGVAFLNRTTQTRVIVESALMAALTTIFVMLNTVPYLTFITFFAAVPIMVLTARQGIKAGIGSSVIMGILVTLLVGPVWGSSAWVMYGISAVAAGHMLRSKMSATQTMLVSGLFFAIGFSILILGAIHLGGADPFVAVTGTFDELIKMTKQNAEVLKSSQEDLNNQIAMIESARDIMVLSKPAMILFIGGILSVTNYFTARLIAIRSGASIKQLTRFRDHRLPSSLLSGILLIVVLSFIADKMGYVDAGVIYLNLEIVFMWLFLFQGVSLLAFLANQGDKNRERRMVIFLFVGLILFFFGGAPLIAMIGLLDTAVDIRKLYENRKG